VHSLHQTAIAPVLLAASPAPPLCDRLATNVAPPVPVFLHLHLNPTPSRRRKATQLPAQHTAAARRTTLEFFGTHSRQKKREEDVDVHAAPAAVQACADELVHHKSPCRPLCASQDRRTVTSWWDIRAYQQHWYVLALAPVIEQPAHGTSAGGSSAPFHYVGTWHMLTDYNSRG
jgi:hypothetical protein